MNKKNKSRNNQIVQEKIKFDLNRNKSYSAQAIKKKNYFKNETKFRPPFSPGLFSYNKSQKMLLNNKINKTKKSRNIKNNNNIFLSKPYSMMTNFSKNTPNTQNNNLAKNMYFSSVSQKKNSKNSLLFPSTINLNKYKINSNESNSVQSSDNINKKNINQFINKSINLNINFNYEKDKQKNEKNIDMRYTIYKNYFISCPKNIIESRRMIIEYIKILNKKEKNIFNILKRNNISERVLNQKYSNINEKNNDPIRQINNALLGERKKELFLNSLNYSFSDESIKNSNDGEDNEPYPNNKNEKKTSVIYKNNNKNNNFNVKNSLNNQKNQKINIINFLCVPKVFNLIESNKNSEKYIFVVVPSEITYLKGFENYKLVLRNMVSNEIENELNIKNIKECYINKNYKNRFIIKVQIDQFNETNLEIETPNDEISEYFTYGINLLSKNKMK